MSLRHPSLMTSEKTITVHHPYVLRNSFIDRDIWSPSVASFDLLRPPADCALLRVGDRLVIILQLSIPHVAQYLLFFQSLSINLWFDHQPDVLRFCGETHSIFRHNHKNDQQRGYALHLSCSSHRLQVDCFHQSPDRKQSL